MVCSVFGNLVCFDMFGLNCKKDKISSLFKVYLFIKNLSYFNDKEHTINKHENISIIIKRLTILLKNVYILCLLKATYTYKIFSYSPFTKV